MDEYANKFLELLRYVQYIRDEQVKVQRFLSGLPQAYKKIELSSMNRELSKKQ